jgi:hypothetical protein
MQRIFAQKKLDKNQRMSNYISFSEDEAKSFKNTYQQAVDNDSKTFFFKGSTFVTHYAELLVEYMDNEIINKKETICDDREVFSN